MDFVAWDRGKPVMTRITLDAELAQKLHELSQSVELCDPSGRVVGRFVPLIDLSEWEPMSPEASPEELERRANSTEWFTFDEVMEHLRNLEKP
jgi:hypothetical protein